MRHTTYRSVLTRFMVLVALVGIGACDGQITRLQPTEAEVGLGLQEGHEAQAGHGALEGVAAYEIPMPCRFERNEYYGLVYLHPADTVYSEDHTLPRQKVDMWGGPDTPLPSSDIPDYIRWSCTEDVRGTHPILVSGPDAPFDTTGFALELLDSPTPEGLVDWFLTYRLLDTPGFETRLLGLALMSADATVPVAIATVEVSYRERPDVCPSVVCPQVQ